MMNQHSTNPTYQELVSELNGAREDLAVLASTISELAALMRAAQGLASERKDLLSLGVSTAMEWANTADVRRAEIDLVLDRAEAAMARKAAA